MSEERAERAVRGLRKDITVKAGARAIERRFRLPEGSVQIILPDQRAPRGDQTIGRLRERWASYLGIETAEAASARAWE